MDYDNADMAKFWVKVGNANGLQRGTKNVEGKQKEPRTVGVVDLWKTKKEDGIILKYRKKIEKLKSDDKLTLLKREYMDKAIPLLSDGTPYCEEHFGLSLLTKETKKQISLLKNEESAEDTKLLLLYKEIMSQLVACETYEQEINILNIYGVLKDGKVNA